MSFNNYVGKVEIDGKEYYVRTTVQKEKNDYRTPSFFVCNVDVYKNPTESRTIPITSRGTTDINGIFDAKLAEFFERASGEWLNDDTSGVHSAFVSNVELYKTTATGRTGIAILRERNSYDGIVNAKLAEFFEMAKRNLEKMRDWIPRCGSA